MKMNNNNRQPNIDLAAIINSIDDKKAVEFYEKSSAQAEDILKDEAKMEELLSNLKDTLKNVPTKDTALAYIPLMMSLVRSYVKKEYTKAGKEAMSYIVVALLYFVSELDLIPDTIPDVGYADDILVIAGCLDLVKKDIEAYRAWLKDNGKEEFNYIPDYENVADAAKDYSKFTDAFFKGKKPAKK